MAKAAMTSRERIMAALRGQETDRPAVGNPVSVATVDSMNATGAFFPEVHQNSEKMAALAAAGHELLGFDTVSPYFSVQQESAALGCNVDWGSLDTMPDLKDPLVDNPEDLRIPENLLDQPPVKTILEAISLLRKRYGNEVAVVGKVMGPWTLSYHVYGVQRFLLDTILDPEKVRSFLTILKEITVLFATTQFEAGADVVTIADHATGDLVSPETYRDFLLPVHQEINRRLNSPTILHICGNTYDRLGYICESGFDNFHFDSKVDARLALQRVNKRITLSGNISNIEVLVKGTPEKVAATTRELIAAGVEIIGPECAVPLRVKNENLKAISATVQEVAGNKVTWLSEASYVLKK